MRLASVLAALALMAAPSLSRAAEVVHQNDSTLAGTPSTVGNVFLSGERAAAWLTASCDGDIVALQVYWASQFGGALPQLEMSLDVYAAGAFPAPGASLASIPGPTLSESAMNEFRYLDPPTNSVPLQVPVSSGQGFVASIEFLNQNANDPFAPSVVYDQDGCQTGANAVFASPGGWVDACLAGVNGDWVIRAVVDCVEVPAVDGAGRLALAVVLLAAGATGAAAIARRRFGSA